MSYWAMFFNLGIGTPMDHEASVVESQQVTGTKKVEDLWTRALSEVKASGRSWQETVTPSSWQEIVSQACSSS